MLMKRNVGAKSEADGNLGISSEPCEFGCPQKVVSLKDLKTNFEGLDEEKEYFPINCRAEPLSIYGISPKSIFPKKGRDDATSDFRASVGGRRLVFSPPEEDYAKDDASDVSHLYEVSVRSSPGSLSNTEATPAPPRHHPSLGVTNARGQNAPSTITQISVSSSAGKNSRDKEREVGVIHALAKYELEC